MKAGSHLAPKVSVPVATKSARERSRTAGSGQLDNGGVYPNTVLFYLLIYLVKDLTASVFCQDIYIYIRNPDFGLQRWLRS